MNILFPLIGAAVVFAIVLGFAAFIRYLQHKEILALAEKGLVKPEAEEGKGKAAYRWGIILVAIGFILIMMLLPYSWNSFWLLLLVGLFPLALGLGLMMIYVLMQDSPAVEEAEIKTKKALKSYSKE